MTTGTWACGWRPRIAGWVEEREDRTIIHIKLDLPDPTRTDTPPVIDGRLDEEVWKSAGLITEFVQQAPLDGAPATEETEVYVAYDSEKPLPRILCAL